MGNRYFSDSVKLEVITSNMKKNQGSICCEVCHAKLESIDSCHFDHIHPFSKGGKSTLDNCQILCKDCNLAKSAKQLQDFAIEEKAKAFLQGKSIDEVKPTESVSTIHSKPDKMTKEKFDAEIQRFIDEKGDIHQIDFMRERNHLPGISYMVKYYGTLNNLKTSFGIADISANWNRETIREALTAFVRKNGRLVQKDMRKENGLPSINCILNYYPEYKDFTDIKRHLCGLDVPERWTRESVIEAGKRFVADHNGKLTQKDCRAENGLPATDVIYKH